MSLPPSEQEFDKNKMTAVTTIDQKTFICSSVFMESRFPSCITRPLFIGKYGPEINPAQEF